MDADPLSPQPKRSWLSRLFGGSFSPAVRTVKTVRTEDLSLTVQTEHADAVRAAVERWLAGRGITATLASEDVGEGKTRLKAHLDQADAAKLDFRSDEVQSELQKLLAEAVS
jgi:uncharacterized protein YgfB (UPF0149 family)